MSCKRWILAVLAILLVFLTYPMFEPDYSVGLDPSYVWGFNWLFSYDYETLTGLIFTYGPLGLLRIPTIENGHFIAFLIFYTAAKLLFVLLAMQTGLRHRHKPAVIVVALIPACLFANIDILLVMDVALLALWTIEKRILYPFLVAVAIATVALFIKITFGIQAFGCLFMAWIIYIARHKDWKHAIVFATSVPVAMAVIGGIVYQGFPQLMKAFEGMYYLTTGWSDGMVLEAGYNHWKVWLFVLLFLCYPLTVRNWNGLTLYLLLLIPMFATWKHGILREDYFHFKQFAYFAITELFLLPMTQESKHVSTWIGSTVCSLLLLWNIPHTTGGAGHPIVAAGPANGWNMTVNYGNLKAKSLDFISSETACRQLPDSTIQQIGNASVDCYPWEYIYLGVNHLHWQPRATIGGIFSPWISENSSKNYRGEKAVQYLLFHKPECSPDDEMMSLDERYLLNDEPTIVMTLMENYVIADTGSYGLLLQYRVNNAPQKVMTIEKNVVTEWDRWVEVPESDSNAVVRGKVYAEKSLRGHVRDFLYKTNIYYIDYLMDDSTMVTYRYQSSTATEGLWISPCLRNYRELYSFWHGQSTGRRPVAIRLRSAHPKCQKESVKIVFEMLGNPCRTTK